MMHPTSIFKAGGFDKKPEGFQDFFTREVVRVKSAKDIKAMVDAYRQDASVHASVVYQLGRGYEIHTYKWGYNWYSQTQNHKVCLQRRDVSIDFSKATLNLARLFP